MKNFLKLVMEVLFSSLPFYLMVAGGFIGLIVFAIKHDINKKDVEYIKKVSAHYPSLKIKCDAILIDGEVTSQEKNIIDDFIKKIIKD